MKQKIEGKVYKYEYSDNIQVEFGRNQGELWFSSKGKINRALKLKNGDKVVVTIEKK